MSQLPHLQESYGQPHQLDLPIKADRYIPGMGGRTSPEHFQQYFLAAGFAKDREVLDISCGEGYGSAILSRVAASVLGVDAEAAIVSRARHIHSGPPNLSFEGGSIEKLPFPDAAFDLITCFETIEFTYDPVQAIKELRRILRPDGTLFISTANWQVYKRAFKYENAPRVHKLEPSSFEKLLQSSFPRVMLLGQTTTSASFVAPLDEAHMLSLEGASPQLQFVARDTRTNAAHPNASAPIYYLAVCGSEEIEVAAEALCADLANKEAIEDELAFRRMLDTPDIDPLLLRTFLEQVSEGRNGAEERAASDQPMDPTEAPSSLKGEVRILRRALSSLMREHEIKLSARQQQLEGAERRIAELSLQLRTIETSTSWRALGRVQRILSKYGHVRQFIRRITLPFSSAGELK